MKGQPGLFGENRKPIGNKTLVDYGVQNEGSDYRFHVGSRCGMAFVFETSEGLKATEGLQLKRVRTNGIETSTGWPVPLQKIVGIRQYYIPSWILKKFPIYEDDDPTIAGMKATQIAQAMLENGMIALPMKTKVVGETQNQIEGTDLIVWCGHKIQVKCDRPAGPRPEGSGNVFLQKSECNPFRYT